MRCWSRGGPVRGLNEEREVGEGLLRTWPIFGRGIWDSDFGVVSVRMYGKELIDEEFEIIGANSLKSGKLGY